MPQSPTTSMLINNLAVRNSAILFPSSSSWEGSGQWNEQCPHHCRGHKADVRTGVSASHRPVNKYQLYQDLPGKPSATLIETLWISVFSPERWRFNILIKPTSQHSWASLLVIAQCVFFSKFINWLCDLSTTCRKSPMILFFPK